jgi:hypothetical protein
LVFLIKARVHDVGFENRALRKIRETKREKITGDWRKLHIEELFDFCHHQTILGWYMKGDQMRS